VLLDLYYEKSCFWAKALVAFGPFGWLLAFTKAKAGSKAQPKGPSIALLQSQKVEVNRPDPGMGLTSMAMLAHMHLWLNSLFFF
jgi:hypothetical protein